MMKLITILMVFAMFAAPAFAQEQQAEQAGEQAEQAAEEAGEAAESAGEAAESAGEAAEQQAEQTGEAVEQETEQAEQEVLGSEQEIDSQVAEGVFKLGALQGTALVDSNGEEVGEFQDALLTDGGEVSHVIAELSEVQDLESGRYAIPASALSFQNQNMVLDMQGAAQFSRIEEGQKPQDAGEFDVLLSRLRDFEVIDNQGESVGEVEDVVVDLQSGQINYMALSFGGILGVGDEMFAVPYSDVWYNLSDETIRVNVSEQRLEQLEGFDQDNWPTQSDEGWTQQAQGEQEQQDMLGVEETGEAAEEQAEETGEAAEEQAEETGEAVEEQAEEAGEAAEEAGEAVEEQAEETGEAVEEQTQQ